MSGRDDATLISVVANANLAAARRRLSGFPPHLRVFDRIIGRMSARNDVSLGISGSLATGLFDTWSDIDIEIIAHDDRAVDEVLAWVNARTVNVAPRLARFSADHVGLENILVTFFLEDGVVVKVDLYTLPVSEYLELNQTVLIRDPGGVVRAAAEAHGPASDKPPNYRDLDQKLCGWLWYTHMKIERGEYLEAANSIEIMRCRALVPMLRGLAGLVQEGCRRLEFLLRGEWLARLSQTVPPGADAAALRAALLELGRFYVSLRPEISEVLGVPADDHALKHMLRIIEQGTGLVERPDE